MDTVEEGDGMKGMEEGDGVKGMEEGDGVKRMECLVLKDEDQPDQTEEKQQDKVQEVSGGRGYKV